MTRSNSLSRQAPAKPESFWDCLSYFLTPQVWKQVQRAVRPRRFLRWHPRPLILVLLMMTWCLGDSSAERFETARAFYVASYQRRQRPGKTFEGFQRALARVPRSAWRVVAGAVRYRLEQVFAHRLLVDGFIPLGCDGSRLECPRSAQLEQRLSVGSPTDSAPMIWITAVVHLSLGVLWSWRLGKGTASERDHLVHLFKTLPRRTLLVADAGYVGYELCQALVAARISFLIRLSSQVPLYAPEKIPFSRTREGLAYYWPQWAQQDEQKPIPVRVLRLRGRKVDVWLMTNILDPQQLPRKTASQFYRWRWRNEGLFRTYKRTLGKVKLMSRTVAQVHCEAEGSLLAVQLLLAQGALALQFSRPARVVLPSARKVLLEIRTEIRNTTGMYLGPRQRRTYFQRLEKARVEERRHRSNQVRRPWPARKDHQPPKPPEILKMGTILKCLLQQLLGAA
jgi:Transposase DDE domain